MKAFWQDFEFAQTTGVMVEVQLVTGERLLSGVHEVHEEDNYVSLYSPQFLGGEDMTMRKVDGDLIVSVSVTDVEWSTS